jgi:uncharacterized protein
MLPPTPTGPAWRPTSLTSALDLAATEPDCVPGAMFLPEEGVVDQVRSALGWGARVFKIHAPVGGFDLREPILDGVWGVLSDAAVPVVVHVGSGPVPRQDSRARTNWRA